MRAIRVSIGLGGRAVGLLQGDQAVATAAPPAQPAVGAVAHEAEHHAQEQPDEQTDADIEGAVGAGRLGRAAAAITVPG
jgi:hypothetical protein